jgi:hypothetical protein
MSPNPRISTASLSQQSLNRAVNSQSLVIGDPIPRLIRTLSQDGNRLSGGIFSGIDAEKLSAIVDRFWSKVNRDRLSDCWLWTASTMSDFGYGQFTVRCAPGPQRHLYAHRVSWELAHGPIPNGLQILHRCDVPLCVNPDHLFLGTQADNLIDARQKGRLDESRPRQRTLSYADRLSIFNAEGYRGIGVALARQYGVTEACISYIRRGRFARLKNQPLQPPAPQPQQPLSASDVLARVFERVPHVIVPSFIPRGEVA